MHGTFNTVVTIVNVIILKFIIKRVGDVSEITLLTRIRTAQ